MFNLFTLSILIMSGFLLYMNLKGSKVARADRYISQFARFYFLLYLLCLPSWLSWKLKKKLLDLSSLIFYRDERNYTCVQNAKSIYFSSQLYVLVMREGEKAQENCFHPIPPNIRIMRLLATTVFSVVSGVSIPNRWSVNNMQKNTTPVRCANSILTVLHLLKELIDSNLCMPGFSFKDIRAELSWFKYCEKKKLAISMCDFKKSFSLTWKMSNNPSGTNNDI